MDSLSTPVACLNCREKHLKCDGNTNGCVRCMSLDQPCYFVPSRRGRKTRPGPLPSIPVDVEGDVIEFIGSQYLPAYIALDKIDLLLSSTDEADLSVEKVQAYLLLSVFSHGHLRPDNARTCITRAVHNSLELGLHQREAESVRRTWWEIFVVDTILAAVQVNGSLQFNMTENPDVPLPHEDDESVDGRISRPRSTLRDLERELLPHNDGEFSSLAYRIEATAMLRKSLIMAEAPSSQRELDLLDASIAAWFHRIPRSKRSIIRDIGEVDQILFQAHMFMHCASIYLHYPRSYLLAFLPSSREIFCPRFPGPSTSSANPQIHTATVVRGAVSVSKLAVLSTSVINHSPFVACMLVLSSVIQLAILSVDWLPPFGADSQFLSLNIGILNSMGDTWPIAGNTILRIREITREVQAGRAGDSGIFLDTLVV
ncbi:hypothetical protein BJX63DRAFT_418674 [Aspergillus granulosus]|uniref:Zn(2)-C6 fungal-type domain-containing protein n=1 Tax=Aspergillus granulosus TaxID=176169 RepID=A0ABR4HW38_9EURO